MFMNLLHCLKTVIHSRYQRYSDNERFPTSDEIIKVLQYQSIVYACITLVYFRIDGFDVKEDKIRKSHNASEYRLRTEAACLQSRMYLPLEHFENLNEKIGLHRRLATSECDAAIAHRIEIAVLQQRGCKFSGPDETATKLIAVTPVHDLRAAKEPLRIMAPCTTKRATLEEDRLAYARTIIYGKFFNTEY